MSSRSYEPMFLFKSLELDHCAAPLSGADNKTMCESVSLQRQCVGWLIGYNGELNLSCHLDLKELQF